MSNIYTVELALYTPPGVFKTLLPDWETIEVQEELSAVGAIKLTYPRKGHNYTSIGDLDELAFLMNGQEKFRFVVEEWSGQSEDAAQGNAVETIAGRSLLCILDRAVVHPPNFPSNTPPHHKYVSATVGQMMKSQIDKAKTRGGLLDLLYNFTNTNASDGVAWADNDIDMELKAGTNLLTLHDQFVESGLMESRMVGKTLRLLNNSDSNEFTDRTQGANPTIVRLGRDITNAPRTRSARALRNVVLVEGNNNLFTSRSDGPSITQFERREEYARAGGYRTIAHMNKYGDRVVAKHKLVQEQHSFELALHGGGPVPWVNYNVGDLVLADLGAGNIAVRVLTIAAKFDRDGVRSASVTLGMRLVKPSRGLLKVVQGQAGGPSPATPLAAPPIVSDALDVMPPAQVIGVGGTGSTYADGLQHKALVNLSWAQVVTNQDGTVLEDLATYMIQYKPTSVTDWSASATVPAPAAQIRELVPGVSYDFRIAAQDTNFNIGLWSSTFTIVVPVDTTAPNAPSTPVVAGTFYGVTVTWNGLDNGGAAMPADFSHVEVHMSTVNNFTPGPTTIKSSFVNRAGETVTLPTDAYGVTHYVKLRALDNAQNVSAASAQASGIPEKLVPDDLDIIVGGRNLMPNSSAEINLDGSPTFADGWANYTGTGARAVDGADFFDGKWSQSMTTDGVTANERIRTPSADVAVGVDVKPSIWVKAPAGVSVKVDFKGANSSNVEQVTYTGTQIVTATGALQRIIGPSITPTQPKIFMAIGVNGTPAAGQVLKWDAAQVEYGNVATSYSPSPYDASSDGVAPASSPTPTVQGGVASLFIKWTAVANADPVTYEVHVSPTSGFAPSGATLVGETPSTFMSVTKRPDGTALGYSLLYVKLVAKDRDGSAAAGSQGSATPLRVDTADIAADSVGADKIPFKDFGNLWPDGSFESAWARLAPTTGWTFVNDVNSPHGNWHARYTPADAPAPVFYPPLPGPLNMPTEAGEKFWVRFKVRYSSDVTAGRKVYLQFNPVDVDGVATGFPNTSSLDAPAHDGNWYYISATLTMPANSVNILSVIVYGDPNYRGAGTIDVEVVEIRKVIQTAIIDDAAITSAKIVDAAIVTAKISDLAVTTAKIAALAVTSAVIADAAITTAKIADLAVVNAKIQDLHGSKITADSITATQIAADAITASELAAGSITAAKGQISDLAVVTAKIADLAVTDAKIGSLTVGKITAGTLVADVILGARIKTADTGQRVEINSLGLKQYNAAGALTVDISSTGTAAFTGAISASTFDGGLIKIPVRFGYGDAPGQFQADSAGVKLLHEGTTNYCLNARFDTLTGVIAGPSTVVALKKPFLQVSNTEWAMLPMFGKYALKVTASAAGGYATLELAALEPNTAYVMSWFIEVGKADDTAETNPFPTMYLDWANFKVFEKFGGARQLAVGQSGLYDETFGHLTGAGYTESSGIGEFGGSGRRHHRYLAFTTPSDLTMLAVPAAPTTATAGTGGSIGAGTYYYTVTAVVQGGETTPSTAVSRVIASGTTNTITVNWTAVTGATAYRIYGRGLTGRTFLAEVAAPTVSWLDTGATGPDFWTNEPTVNRTGAVQIRLPAPTDSAGTGIDAARAVMYDGLQIEKGTYPRQFTYWKEPSCHRIINPYQFAVTYDWPSRRFDDFPVTFLHDREPKISGRVITADVVALNSFKKGTGEAQGTNYVTVVKNTATSIAHNTWVDLSFNQTVDIKEDDGPVFSSTQFISQTIGYFGCSVCVEWAGDTGGRRGLRWLTQGGTILSQIIAVATSLSTTAIPVNQTLADYARLSGGGYYIKIQAYQDSGGSLNILAYSSSQPHRANFVQLA